MWPTPNDAAAARTALVTFFAQHLKPCRIALASTVAISAWAQQRH
jgi:hypothetical protein